MVELLRGPYEILELRDGESKELRVVRWEIGEMVIHPRYVGAPAEKRIPVLRVHVPLADKPIFPQYWDVTSKTLQAQMIPFLERPTFRDFRLKITAIGEAPLKRFTLEVTHVPAGP